MRINIHIKTGKTENKVTKIAFAEYEVWVKSQPVKGAANRELLSTLSNYFSVKEYNLRIVSGFKSSLKVIELTK